jgi:hypothetical protein
MRVAWLRYLYLLLETPKPCIFTDHYGLADANIYFPQELKFGVEGRAALLNGVETLAKAVATTLGPKGRNVLIESSFGSPKITKGPLSPG